MAFTHKISKALRSLFSKYRPTLTSPAPLFLTKKLQETIVPAVAPIPTKIWVPKVDLQDHERLYTTVKTRELLRSMATLYPKAVGPAVDLGMAVMRSKTAKENWTARTAVMGVVRPEIYEQFCAGENAEEAAQTLHRLWMGGMRGILDYDLEDVAYGASCDRNLAGFPSAVEMTATLPPSMVNFACLKITAIFPVNHSSADSPLYHTPTAPATLCNHCCAGNLPLLVNAEYTSVQPAIVHGSSKERLIQAIEGAKKAGISIEFKLVRGAYLSREAALASSVGMASPIHGSIQETHACFEDCTAFMIERIVKARNLFCGACHA